MLTRSKLLFAALSAAAMMLTLVASASATEIRVSEREFELVFERGNPLTFEAAGNNVVCPLTMLGHFLENPIRKILNGNIGLIRHVAPTTQAAPPCTGGSFTVLTESLPWNVTYQGFSGRLPEIERIRLLFTGVAFKVHVIANNLTCLAGTTTRTPAAGEVIVNRFTGRVEGLRAEERTTIPLGGGFLCEISGGSHFLGTASVRDLPLLNALTVTLI